MPINLAIIVDSNRICVRGESLMTSRFQKKTTNRRRSTFQVLIENTSLINKKSLSQEVRQKSGFRSHCREMGARLLMIFQKSLLQYCLVLKIRFSSFFSCVELAQALAYQEVTKFIYSKQNFVPKQGAKSLVHEYIHILFSKGCYCL